MILKSIPSLAERLKYIRKMKDMSQIDLAELAATTQQAIQQAESGKAKNPRYLHKIALELDIPYEWLTMNIISDGKGKTASPAGMAEKEKDVLNNFFSMPKKDQALILELMKSRQKSEK